MAVTDTWHRKDGTRTAQYGQSLRWRARWHGRSKSFATKTAAQRWEARARSEAPEPVRPEVTVGELVDQWLAGKQGLSTSRIQGCSAAASRVREHWGDRLADTVLPHEVQAWQAQLPVGAASKRKAMEALSGALRIGVDRGVVDRNPCDKVRRPAEPTRDARFLTPAEVEALVAAAGPYGPMILLMATTGLRIGEACNLRVGDVDRRRRRVQVASATAKNRKLREVGVPAHVVEVLPLKGRARGDWLFLSSQGRRVSERNWRSRYFYPAVERAGLSGVRPHDLRHTAVSLAIRSGADIKVVQRVAGHSSVKLTGDVYGHLSDAGLDDVAARMDGLFGGDDE